MATSITTLANQLYNDISWQETPVTLTESDYANMVLQGIKTLYVHTSRAQKYSDDMVTYSGDTPTSFDQDFKVDEQLYILLTAKINFFKRVQTDVNRMVGYTTDALSITNADKPYANLQDTISGLQNERRIVYYKMIRYCM